MFKIENSCKTLLVSFADLHARKTILDIAKAKGCLTYKLLKISVYTDLYFKAV